MTTLLDTRVVPGPDRPDYWAAGIAEHFFPIGVESFAESRFDARLSGGQVGPLTVRSITGRPHRVARSRRMIAAADPECVLLYVLRSGSCRIEQGDHASMLRAGDIAVQDTSRPSTFEAMTSVDVLVLSFPRWFIGPEADGIARRVATRVSGQDKPFARLVTPFVVGLAEAAERGRVSGPDADGAAGMLLTMLRTFCADDEPGDAVAYAGLLARMQQYVLEHLHEPDLGADRVARAHFVSTRYVHRLFASTGTGLAAWIRECRLVGARQQLLSTPAVSVAQVATHWGYRDPASFTRAFHARFRCTPSGLRAAGAALLPQREARA